MLTPWLRYLYTTSLLPQPVIFGNLASSMRVVVQNMEKLGIAFERADSEVCKLIQHESMCVYTLLHVCMQCMWIYTDTIYIYISIIYDCMCVFIPTAWYQDSCPQQCVHIYTCIRMDTNTHKHIHKHTHTHLYSHMHQDP